MSKIEIAIKEENDAMMALRSVQATGDYFSPNYQRVSKAYAKAVRNRRKALLETKKQIIELKEALKAAKR